jgi:multicomponent Na+:H+ antiporter subunit E
VNGTGAKRIAIAGAVFAVTWLLWSGHYTPLMLGLGALSCALVLVLARRTGFFDVDVYALHLGPRLPGFWCWLAREIVRSNLSVARIVLSRRMPIEPTLVTVDASRLPVVGQATLANSLTLTPGTVSLDVNRGMIEVHCLTREAAAQVRHGEMLRRATALTGD